MLARFGAFLDKGREAALATALARVYSTLNSARSGLRLSVTMREIIKWIRRKLLHGGGASTVRGSWLRAGLSLFGPSLRGVAQQRALVAAVAPEVGDGVDGANYLGAELRMEQADAGVRFIRGGGMSEAYLIRGASLKNVSLFRGRDISKLPQKFLSTLLRVAEACQANEPVLLVGPTSCKSLIVQTYAELVNGSRASLSEVHLTKETESADLIGQIRPVTPRDAALLTVRCWSEFTDRIRALQPASRARSADLVRAVETLEAAVRSFSNRLLKAIAEEDDANAQTGGRSDAGAALCEDDAVAQYAQQFVENLRIANGDRAAAAATGATDAGGVWEDAADVDAGSERGLSLQFEDRFDGDLVLPELEFTGGVADGDEGAGGVSEHKADAPDARDTDSVAAGAGGVAFAATTSDDHDDTARGALFSFGVPDDDNDVAGGLTFVEYGDDDAENPWVPDFHAVDDAVGVVIPDDEHVSLSFHVSDVVMDDAVAAVSIPATSAPAGDAVLPIDGGQSATIEPTVSSVAEDDEIDAISRDVSLSVEEKQRRIAALLGIPGCEASGLSPAPAEPSQNAVGCLFNSDDISLILDRMADLARGVPSWLGVYDDALLMLNSRAAALCERLKKNSTSTFFLFQDGVVTRAAKQGRWLLFEHLNEPKKSVTERLNAMLEVEVDSTMCARRSMTVPEGFDGTASGCDASGAIVLPESFAVFATVHSASEADVVDLSAATRSRFTEVWVPAYEYADVLQIVDMELCADDRGLLARGAHVVEVARACITALVDGVLNVARFQLSLDVRKLVQLCHFVSVVARHGGDVGVACVTGAQLLFFDRMSPTDRHSAQREFLSALSRNSTLSSGATAQSKAQRDEWERALSRSCVRSPRESAAFTAYRAQPFDEATDGSNALVLRHVNLRIPPVAPRIMPSKDNWAFKTTDTVLDNLVRVCAAVVVGYPVRVLPAMH